MTVHHVDGPAFEDFSRGQEFGAPAVTVTDGHAALYQAITGDRLRLPLDRSLSHAVCGDGRAFVHPMLVINLVNGQTTFASQNVKGNLFYRGLVLQAPVYIGDTLNTVTRVVGLRQNTPKPGRDATGMVVLEMETRNQHDECVMKYWRCPMIPCRDTAAKTGHADDFAGIPETVPQSDIEAALPAGWNVASFAPQDYAVPTLDVAAGDRIVVHGQDTVTSAPELVRMTGNIAFTHTDASKSYLGQRLVYGGHTISLAFAQLTRAFPNLVTLLAWQGCDHLGPVLEEDIIASEIEVTAMRPVPAGGQLLELRILTRALRGAPPDLATHDVLDWRLVAWTV